jgi:hypothetical protein
MKLILFLIILYITFSLILLKMYSKTNECETLCEAQLLGNLFTCNDFDLKCCEYYQNIYNQCIQKC